MLIHQPRAALVGRVASALLLATTMGCTMASRPSDSVTSRVPATSTPVGARATLAPHTPTAVPASVLASSPPTVTSAPADVATTLEAAAKYVDETITAVEGGDVSAARAAFAHYSEGWESIEDGVKARAPSAMASIEDATDNASAELRATLSTRDTQLSALQRLRQVLDAQVLILR